MYYIIPKELRKWKHSTAYKKVAKVPPSPFLLTHFGFNTICLILNKKDGSFQKNENVPSRV